MNILFISMYSPPEKTGIGKYNGELVNYISEHHRVYYLTTIPFYPEWKVHVEYSKKILITEHFNNLTIKRIWSYLPNNKITAFRRILKEISFFIFSYFQLIIKKIKGYNPDIIIYIAPPFFLPYLNTFLFKKSKKVYHIQDLEIDAAVELGMLPKILEQILLKLEQKLLLEMDLITTISDGMKRKILTKNDNLNVQIFPNWSNLKTIHPKKSTWLHKHLNIFPEKKLIVYSGNIGHKQGLSILPEIIERICEEHDDIHFVILGEGAYKHELEQLLKNSSSSKFTMSNLVDMGQLNDMLNSSFVQLVLQKSEGADSFMPSKLTNILAAGIPSIITANPGTGLYNLITEFKIAHVVDYSALAVIKGINELLENKELYEKISNRAVNYALNNLDKKVILSGYRTAIENLIND